MEFGLNIWAAVTLSGPGQRFRGFSERGVNPMEQYLCPEKSLGLRFNWMFRVFLFLEGNLLSQCVLQ